ncbi:acetyl-CoA synthetase-like protein [Ascodesmis nigricans]|uniref:Acetyl-CoA synthetase-like protein n=1 Tax=Ascodesmis nigricans TaxID=341454 RepID=A0A4V3SJF7_9PEZI|nr:acetyl-CoA synthetase-like protein [Ascodesmis nigricans]
MRAHFFTTTLGEAQELNVKNPHGLNNINELLEKRAESTPDLAAIGMGDPKSPGQELDATVYSYKELLELANATAHCLYETLKLGDSDTSRPTIAILSESSMVMLLNFLGLIRIGCTVLLIAPQCSSQAIHRLLQKTKAEYLLSSSTFSELAASSAISECPYKVLPDPSLISRYISKGPFRLKYPVESETIGYIHHTSGTTSGRPSPIPQSHAAATKYLPYLPTVPRVATLTTTPLYHGGVADLWRSMMSESMIWFYPPTVPITAANIIIALKTAETRVPSAPVRLFTGVPYIQRICADDPTCLEILRKMDMVGVGGANLPVELGDFMVQNGVNLVSRFGSSECGFLLNSYRNFSSDIHWNYLRIPPRCTSLRFEPYDDKLFELVVLQSWPHMAKTNRPDGSFATSDLFTQHPTIRGAYCYHTRADSTIVLTNGKKFDPTPLEESVRRIKGVEEAVMIGQNRERPGVLVFASASHGFDGEVDRLRREVVDRIKQASGATSFAAVESDTVILYTDGRSLPKSSKGTMIRALAEEEYKTNIDAVYNRSENTPRCPGSPKVDNQDRGSVAIAVARIVGDVVGRDVMGDADLFLLGVDSVKSMIIRRKLMEEIEIEGGELPMNVVFQERTINGLIKFLTSASNEDSPETQYKEMQDLASEYSTGIPRPRPHNLPSLSCVLLTGGTGFLGCHIISKLVRRKVPIIYCVVRAGSNSEAYERLQNALLKRKLSHTLYSLDTAIIPIAADLAAPMLGINPYDYQTLATSVTVIIHAAWPVNFLLPLATFRPTLAGVRNLAILANANPDQRKRFIFCSSVASVINKPVSPILEAETHDPADSSPLGYSRSKWVAEQIVRAAGGDVVRVGQLSADRVNGVWNDSEAWPQLLTAAELVGCVPDLDKVGKEVCWLPVDVAAEVIVRIAERVCEGQVPVWTVANRKPVKWGRVVAALEYWVGRTVEFVSPREWVQRLEKSEAHMDSEIKLLGLWKDLYGSIDITTKLKPGPIFDLTNTGTTEVEMIEGLELSNQYLKKLIEGLNVVQGRTLSPPPGF